MFKVWLLNRIIFYKTNMDWIKPINAFFLNFNGCKTKIEWISDLNNFCWRSSIYLNKKVPTNWWSNIALEYHELSFFLFFFFSLSVWWVKRWNSSGKGLMFLSDIRTGGSALANRRAGHCCYDQWGEGRCFYLTIPHP